jgi:hypothetical protein
MTLSQRTWPATFTACVLTSNRPKETEVTTETKVEAVAWAIVADGYMVDYSDTTKQRCENVAREDGEGANIAIEPLYPASAIAALEARIAELEATLRD